MDQLELDTESCTDASATDLLEDVKKILEGQTQQIEGLENVLQKRDEIISSQSETINTLLSEVTKMKNGLRIERKLRASAEKKQGQMSTELEELKGQLKKEKEGRLQAVRKLSQLGHLNFMGMKIAYEGNCLSTSEEHGYAIRRKEMMELVKLVSPGPSPPSSTSVVGSVSDPGSIVAPGTGDPTEGDNINIPETIANVEPDAGVSAPVIPSGLGDNAPSHPRVVVVTTTVAEEPMENFDGTTPAAAIPTGRHVRTVRFSGGRGNRQQKRSDKRKKFGKGFRHPPSTGQGRGRRSRGQEIIYAGYGDGQNLEYNDDYDQAQDYGPASLYNPDPGFSYCYSPWG